MGKLVLKQETTQPAAVADHAVLTSRSGVLYVRFPSGVEYPLVLSGSSPYVVFTPQNSPPAYQEGILFYDADSNTMALYTDSPDVTLNVGRELWYRAVNNTGSTVLNGQVVFISGVQSDKSEVSLAQAGVNDTHSIIGIATQDILDGDEGEITVFGQIHDLNTSAFTVGDELYLSATTPGALTNVAPSVDAIVVAICARSHPTTGIINVWVRDANVYVKTVDGQAPVSGNIDLSASYEQKRQNNLTATTNPTITDDSNAGYEPLSRWINTVTNEIWLCISAAVGAANWQQATLTLDELGSAALADVGTGPTQVPTNADLGSAAYTASTDYATAAQGNLADSALQDGDIVATLTVTDLSSERFDADSITLNELSALYPGLNVVDAAYYDTTKDSDGGEWTKRTGSLSYGTEAVPSGRYVGQFSAFADVVAAGGVVNDWYYNPSNKTFRRIDSIGPDVSTEIFRAGSATFPKQVVIVAESNGVIIFDATKDQLEMWMVFVSTANVLRSNCGSITMEEGSLVWGSTTNGSGVINFTNNVSRYRIAGAYRESIDDISNRNSGNGFIAISTNGIVSSVVNDVAMTVLDSAPIDPITGLRVPTIAVATAGGVSVIKDDGTVVDSADTTAAFRVAFDKEGRLYFTRTGSVLTRVVTYNADGFTGNTYDSYSTVPKVTPFSGNTTTSLLTKSIAQIIKGSSEGVCFLHEDLVTKANGMVSYITSDYNTGWMQGDIKLAALCDTETGNISAPELVTNGTFDTDVSDWQFTSNGNGSFVYGTNDADLTSNGGSGYPIISQGVPTIVGKTYLISLSYYDNSTGLWVRKSDAGNTTGGTNQVTFANNVTGVSGTIVGYFTATATTSHLNIFAEQANAGTVTLDNISVVEVTPDRSGNSNHLTINGTLSRAPIGNGEIAAWSGFSATNYLEMPYSADFDFGTGDFYIAAKLNLTTPPSNQVLFERTDIAGTGGGRIRLILLTTDQLRFELSDDNGATTDVVTASIVDGKEALYVARVVSGNLIISVDDGALVSAPIVNTNLGVSNATAIITIGCTVTQTNPALNMSALTFRMGAGAPSADQIKKIYHDELAMIQGKATLDGTSDSVIALAYDKLTNLLHAVTSWGRSAFRGLERVESEATTIGAPTAVFAEDGNLLLGSATNFASTIKDVNVRSDIKHPSASTSAVLVDDLYYTATGGETDIYLGKGFTASRVWKNAAPQKKKQGATANDFSIQFNGFEYFIRFASALTASDDIIIERVRT